jgi:hypothetical protein
MYRQQWQWARKFRPEGRHSMTKKAPAKASKDWSPGDPIRFDKAILQPNAPNQHIAEKLAHADDALASHVHVANHAIKPTNNKPFNRQKKG